MINRKIPWTSQPQYPVEIDWSNPLASRCLGVYLPANNNSRSGNPSRTVSSFGIGDTFLRTSSQHITIPLTSPISLTSSGATLIGIFNSTNIAAAQCAFALTDGGSHFSVLPRGDIAGDPISVASWNTSGSSFRQFIGPSYASGVNYVIAITTDTAGNFDIYRDGVLQSGSYTNGGTIPSVSMTKLEIGASNGTGDFLSGSVFSVLAFKGRLNQQEIKVLSDNPWQIFKSQSRRIWVAGTSSGSTGTVAVTNANDTSSASGATTVTGSVAKSNANDTSAASGTTTITGSLARTNVNDTSAASGTTTVTGTLATTNANDTVSASGSVGNSITGTVAYTNANDTLSASGTTTIVGTVSRTNANDTSTANGTTTVIGTVSYTNANDTVTASGIAGTISGTVAYTNANDISTASGSAGPVSEAGRLGGFEYGSKVYIKRDKKIYIFDSVEEADSYLEAEAKAEEIVQQSNKTSRLARKRAREKAHKLLSIEPVESVDIPALKTLVSQLQTGFELPKLIAKQDWQRVVEIYQQAMEMQDEEDLLLIL